MVTAPARLLALSTVFFATSFAPCLGQVTPASDDTEVKVVEITATDYAFQAPNEIPSGWTTLRFTNEGEEPHFIFLSRLPEGKTADDYEADLSVPFNKAWTALRDGEVNQEEGLEMLFGSLPEWFAATTFVGGSGFAAPGLTSETVVNLEPGNYVLECYMKTADGNVHYMEGMLRPLYVTEERSDAGQPASDVRITLSNDGIHMDGDLTPGRRTFEVQISENPEEGFGHSVHLARLTTEADVDEIVQWMNWFSVDGLRSPGPAEFIGGTQLQMPIGQSQYFTADLEPGRYLFISENTAHMGVLKEVTIE